MRIQMSSHWCALVDKQHIEREIVQQNMPEETYVQLVLQRWKEEQDAAEL